MLKQLFKVVDLLQVLEKDLAIFGFFIALGRSSQSFLSANGFDVIDDPIESFLRYSSYYLMPFFLLSFSLISKVRFIIFITLFVSSL